MSYTISGRVCARPCEGFEIPIPNGTLLFYRHDEDTSEGRREIDGTRTQLDGNGEFEGVTIGEEQVRPGEPIVVDIVIPDPCADEAKETIQTTYTGMEFAESGEDRKVDWCFTPDQYCGIMEELGCRYVCGQVTDCETGIPLPALQVEVFDADIVEPDPLGTDTTDANGWYLIYYSETEFEKTPSPFPPIELIGGADLFFEISYGSNTLLGESPSDGRQSDREDAGYCEHIDHCVDYPGRPRPPAWLAVGRYTIPDSNSLNDFDKRGYTASSRYAFFGSLHLEGELPVGNVPIRGAGSNPIRYRFKVGDSQLENGSGGTPSQFNQIVGDGNNLFSGVTIGWLYSHNPFDVVKVEVEPGDLKPGGWVRADEAIRNANTSMGLGNYHWSDTGKLAKLDTEPLTTESMPPEQNTDAGQKVPGNPPVDDETIAIQFEVQEQTGNTWRDLPGSGWSLNRIVVNNNTEFRKARVVQLDQDRCQPITTQNVDLRYTVYHPHMSGAQVHIQRNDQSNWTRLDDTATELSFANVSTTDGKFDHNHNDRFDISSDVDKECAYIVRFRSRRRLTTGRSRDGWNSDLLAFCAREKREDEEEDAE